MPDCFSTLATVAPRAVKPWDSAMIEKVSEPDFVRSRLDEDRAFGFVKALVEL